MRPTNAGEAFLPQMNGSAPIVAILGGPNVGKSTLFNLLVEGQKAITSPVPGTTRDRLEGRLAGGSGLRIMDTAGLGTSTELGKKLDNSLMSYLPKAGAAVFVVNPGPEISDGERRVADILRKEEKPVLLVCNKCDREEDDLRASEFARLGLGMALPTSAVTGRNILEFRRRVAGIVALSGTDRAGGREDRIEARFAVMGQPNVGKSSVFNRMLKEERSIVDHEPGTTRDPVRARMPVSGGIWEVIDTAGVSHRWRRSEMLQKRAQEISLKTLAGIDVAVLVLDLTVSLARQDLRLIRAAVSKGAALTVAMNKADLVPEERKPSLWKESLAYMQKRFPQIGRFPVLFCSAKTGEGMAALPAAISDLVRLRKIVIPASALADVSSAWPSSGAAWRIYQIGSSPPAFAVRPPEGVRRDSRFVANRLRDAFGLHGVPLLIRWKERKSR